MRASFKLPLLEKNVDALEKCVYCPKLSRAACPVSNVEANETVTPWGKMSLAFFTARGDVPVDDEHAAPAWACSACYACRERCEHHNEVARVLLDARSEYFARGVAPEAARTLAASWSARELEHRLAVERLAQRTQTALADADARRVLLVGCGYARALPDQAAAIVRVATLLVGGLSLLTRCCGLPLLYAGDGEGFARAARDMADALQSAERVLVADPGCAHCMRSSYERPLARGEAQPLIDVVYAELERLPARALSGRALRYVDPCQLGRGLGRYEEPRAVIARLTGAPPSELLRSRSAAECSGGGGLLPLTRPSTSATMAAERLAEHDALGGGTLVTACAASTRRLGGSNNARVVDLMSLVDEALSYRDR